MYFAPFLEKLGVPWVFLRDGDGEGVKAEAALLSKLREVLGLADGAPDPPLSVVALSGMIEDELDALGAAVVDPVLDHHPAGPLNDYADRLDGQKKKGGTVRDYKGDAGRARARRDLLAQDKPATARVFGEYLAGVNPATWPVGLQAFFKKIDALCGRPPKEIS